MNQFCDLTVTSTIPVSVRYHDDGVPGKVLINDQDTTDTIVSITADIVITSINACVYRVEVDGIDITDHVYNELDSKHLIHIPGPFYLWWHQTSGQGWLLYPHLPG